MDQYFVVQKKAQVLSKKFNEKGYFTIALTGEDSQEKREEAINRLTSKNIDEKIDYILQQTFLMKVLIFLK